jgi:hypothetical protein
MPTGVDHHHETPEEKVGPLVHAHERAPKTHEIGALAAGTMYAHATGSRHDLGPLPLPHLSMANFNPAMLLAELVILEAAFGFGDPQGVHGFGEGYIADVIPGACHCVDSGCGDYGRKVIWGKDNKDLRMVQTCDWPGRAVYAGRECDPMGFIEQMATAPRGAYLMDLVAKGQGMRRIYPGVMDPANVDRPIKSNRLGYEEFDYITSVVPFILPDHPTNKPPTWRRKVKGKTRIARRSFQLIKPGREAYRTYLIASVAQWFMDITRRKQTYQYTVNLCQFLVWSAQTAPSGVWRGSWDEILEHRMCAEALAEATSRYIKTFIPDPRAVAALRDTKPEQFEPLVPRKIVEKPVLLTGLMGGGTPEVSIGVDEDDARRLTETGVAAIVPKT